MVGHLNAKHTEWNSGLNTARASILRDYAHRNSCLIHGPDSPTTAVYTHNATPDFLDIVVVKDFVLSLYLCSATSSDHPPLLNDTAFLSSRQYLLYPLLFTRMDWAVLEACLEDRLRGNHAVNDEEAIDKWVEELTSAISRGHSFICSQESTLCQRAAYFTHKYSG
jgi:hypothetical protein